jgi:IS5 family transposase
MKQQTLTGLRKYGMTTRRAPFLGDMDRIIAWPEMTTVVQAVYPKISENGGRPPIPMERMLRVYFLQLWFNLSDPGVEDALYDSFAMRHFVGIDLGAEGAPDETTVCKFRQLLERRKLEKTLLSAVNEHLHRSGIKISKSTVVDATIIGAPSATKNKDGKPRPSWCTRSWHRQRMWPIRRRCRTCCMAGKRGFGATRPIADRRRRCARCTAHAGLHQPALTMGQPDRYPD